MNWKKIYPLLKTLNKEKCVSFAEKCFELSNPTEELINLEKDKNWKKAAIIRKMYNNESAHIIIHVVAAKKSSDNVSAAGHAARCWEALCKIDSKLGEELYKTIGEE